MRKPVFSCGDFSVLWIGRSFVLTCRDAPDLDLVFDDTLHGLAAAISCARFRVSGVMGPDVVKESELLASDVLQKGPDFDTRSASRSSGPLGMVAAWFRAHLATGRGNCAPMGARSTHHPL